MLTLAHFGGACVPALKLGPNARASPPNPPWHEPTYQTGADEFAPVGPHLGRMQVSQDAERVERSMGLPVCAYLLLIHLYGRGQAPSQGWSLFQLKQRFTETLMQDQVNRVEQKWQRKRNEIKEAA